ncbi:MAG: ABC transporter permease [Candidatus Aenigmatarchaeota archaeon]
MSTSKNTFIIYKPNQRRELNYLQTWIIMTKNIINSRDLIWQLFKRDYFATYKKSFIGIAWVLFSPIIGIISWVFLRGAGFLNPGDVGIPYPAYVLIGTSMWGLFMGFFSASTQMLETGNRIVIQVNFPHEALLFPQTAIHLSNFFFSFLVNIIVLIIFGIKPSWGIIWLPLVILPLFFFGSAIGLITSIISIVAIDISKIISTIMGLLLFITPIIYSDKIGNVWVQQLIKWNPLTYLVCSARDIVLFGRLYHTTGYFICAIISFIVFLIAGRLFYVSENKIIEKMI